MQLLNESNIKILFKKPKFFINGLKSLFRLAIKLPKRYKSTHFSNKALIEHHIIPLVVLFSAENNENNLTILTVHSHPKV